MEISVSLDKDYGPVIPPQTFVPNNPGYKSWEESHTPSSITALKEENISFLKQIMDEISKGWALGKVLTRDITIIWVVSADGTIWFSVEEIVLDEIPLGIPTHRTMRLTASTNKLGHPSLVSCAPARIGGEILFDETLDPPSWVINNKSGRYGYHESRTAQHLKNVQQKFTKMGIKCVPRFSD